MREGSPPDPRLSHLFVNSLDKGFNVLRAFAGARGSLSLMEIASSAGLDRSAAQRFTHTLVTLGYVKKDGLTKRYRLSPRVLEFGVGYLQADPRIECALPHMLATAKRSKATVNLTELDDCDVVYVARVPSQNVVRVNLPPGTRAPAYCTATGRVMLGFLPRPEAVDILERSRLVQYTSTTIVDRGRLLAILDKVHREGFAVTSGEWHPGTVAIAAPVFDYGEHVIAAVSVSLPATAWTMQKVRHSVVPIIVGAASRISADLARRVCDS